MDVSKEMPSERYETAKKAAAIFGVDVRLVEGEVRNGKIRGWLVESKKPGHVLTLVARTEIDRIALEIQQQRVTEEKKA